MQQELNKIKFIIGNYDVVSEMQKCKEFPPFDSVILDFLERVGRRIMSEKRAREYPDVVTFAFWCRRANLVLERERYSNVQYQDVRRLGRGIIFHVAPSNVPVNYAYSMAAGFLAGNANIVRIPSKSFPQVELVNQAFLEILDELPRMKPYLALVQYERNQKINDYFSSKCNVRVVWGGDVTISEIRQSPLRPRATEIMFADRDSLCVIGSERYLKKADTEDHFVQDVADAFYNDTYLTDQNACTSPSLLVWLGAEEAVTRAKDIFWSALKARVEKKYEMQPIQAVNKYAAFCKLAATHVVAYEKSNWDNRIIRVEVKQLVPDLMEYKENSGYFLEYQTEQLCDISILCSEKCQTVSYVGVEKEELLQLIDFGVKGIDRMVPVGKTMDFDLRWDGYCLIERMSRGIHVIANG